MDIHRSEISSFSSFSSCKQIGNVSKRIEISNIISLSSRRIYYIYVKKNNRRNLLSKSFNFARNDISKKDRKESSSSLVNFWRTNARSRVHAFRRVEGSGLYANECTVIHESKEEEVSGERERERGRKGTWYPKGGHERAGRHRYIGAHGEATSRVHLDLRLVSSPALGHVCESRRVTFLTSAPTCSPLTQVARATGSEQIRTLVNCHRRRIVERAIPSDISILAVIANRVECKS